MQSRLTRSEDHWTRTKQSLARPCEILLVYDEEATRAVVIDALGAVSEVVETRDATAALGLLEASGHHFDVAIVTCLACQSRPNYARHVELVRTMFQRWPWVPAVIITRAQEAAQLTGALLLSGAREFVVKPFVAGTLIATVARVVPRPGRLLRVPEAAIATIKRVLAFLAEHVTEQPTLGDLATAADMSRSHFSHTFHAVAGMPLRDYVRDLRLKHAHELLLISALPIGTIATESGFYDQPHLDKAFRQRIGMSPMEYRRRYARDGAEGRS
jgi:AraC-like DNA-binding protein/CheY-like chemotaxis protein